MAGCKKQNDITEPDDKKGWESVAMFLNADVRAMKVQGNVLYVAGIFPDGTCFIKKSKDLKTWSDAVPVVNKYVSSIRAITFRDNQILFAGEYTPVYQYDEISVKPVSDTILGVVTDICANKDEIYVGLYWQYNFGIVTRDSTYYIQCNLSGAGEHGQQIKQFSITSIKQNTFLGSNYYFLSNIFASEFLTYLNNGIIERFNTTGLSSDDLYHGVDDFAIAQDTIFACTYGCIKAYSNSTWKIWNDSLPLTPWNFRPYATAITCHESKLVVGTNYVGILQWEIGKGWEQVSQGLPRDSDGFYEAVSFLASFNGKLVAAYGINKSWPAKTYRGLYVI